MYNEGTGMLVAHTYKGRTISVTSPRTNAHRDVGMSVCADITAERPVHSAPHKVHHRPAVAEERPYVRTAQSEAQTLCSAQGVSQTGRAMIAPVSTGGTVERSDSVLRTIRLFSRPCVLKPPTVQWPMAKGAAAVLCWLPHA